MLICKLRFFISLICDSKKDPSKPNYGIIPLPNLETKFVAANSLLPAKLRQFDNDVFVDAHLRQLQDDLLALRQGIFDLRTHAAKLNNKRRDREKCREIKAYIRQNATQPNKQKLELFEKQIADCEAKLPLYEGECWVEEMTTTQTSLFEEPQPTLFRKDVNKEKRERLQAQIRSAKAEIEKEQSKKALPGFEEAVDEVTEWDPYNQNAVAPFFDAEWMFGIVTDKSSGEDNRPSKQGFDIVIGNPPYISVRTKSFDASLKPMYKALYTLAVGQYDLYTLFIEHAHKVLSKKGVLAFIIPTRMLSNENFMPARQFVMNNMPIISYVNAQKPFESANVEANIMVCKKGISKPSVSAEVLDNNTNTFKHVAIIPFESIFHMPFNIFPFVFKQEILNVLFHIQENTDVRCLLDYVEITRGFECGYNDSRIGKGKYPFIMSESIYPYVLNQNTAMYCDPDFTNISKYKTKEVFLDVPKLLTKFCSNEIKFSLDEIGYCNTNSVYNCSIKPSFQKDLNYLIGILNSNLTTFWFNTAFLNIDSIFPHIQKNQLEAIPIVQADKTTHKDITTLVDKIFSAKKANPHADTSEWEKEIDELVYKLYGLSEEEIRIVKGGL